MFGQGVWTRGVGGKSLQHKHCSLRGEPLSLLQVSMWRGLRCNNTACLSAPHSLLRQREWDKELGMESPTSLLPIPPPLHFMTSHTIHFTGAGSAVPVAEGVHWPNLG